MADVRSFVPAIILGLGLGLLSMTHEQVRPNPVKPIAAILDTVPGYTHTAVEVDTNSQRVAGMDEFVNRVYLRDTMPMFSLYVGYYTYQTQGKSIHSPRNCLPGAGWEPVESTTLPIASAPGTGTRSMNKYVLANQGSYAAVYYWYQGRGRIESNEYTVKYNLMHDAALYGRTEEALVRIVVPLMTMQDRSQENIRREITRADSLATSLAPRLAREVAVSLPAAPGA
ncbi:MAG TPA: EpsI family protein [Gemmatimonadaceae bacterium]|nr:EpsI family protein [Gemmatimonadaceae bacterium]